MPPLLKLAVEVGPIGVFFLANMEFGIFTATAAFMAAIAVAVLVSWIATRRLPVLPLASAIFVLVFGGLTLYLNDALFIKLKPTIVNALFGLILMGGLAVGRPLLKPVLGTVLPAMHEPGWRKLTLRWALFFFALAALNEIVWRTVSTDTWVTFKVFGILPLMLVFNMSQIPLIRRHAVIEDVI